jgi:hypothetical protein
MTDKRYLQDKIDAFGAWELDTVEIAMDALRTPEGRYTTKKLIWWRTS